MNAKLEKKYNDAFASVMNEKLSFIVRYGAAMQALGIAQAASDAHRMVNAFTAAEVFAQHLKEVTK